MHSTCFTAKGEVSLTASRGKVYRSKQLTVVEHGNGWTKLKLVRRSASSEVKAGFQVIHLKTEVKYLSETFSTA